MNWMNIDLPSLQSIENVDGASFFAVCSVIMESIEFDKYKWTNMI